MLFTVIDYDDAFADDDYYRSMTMQNILIT